MADAGYFPDNPSTADTSAAQVAARVLQAPVVSSDYSKDHSAYTEPSSATRDGTANGLDPTSSYRQPTSEEPEYSATGQLNRATSNPKSYAARMQTKPGLAIATSTRSGPDGLYMTPTSPTDTDYYAGKSPTAPQSATQRRSSVTDKSPLQKLEGHLGSLSKEEKRARAEEAEAMARQRGTEHVERKPVGSATAYPQRNESLKARPEARTTASLTNTTNETSNSRNVSSSSAPPARVTSGSYSTQPTSPTGGFSRTPSQRYGHDAALTGGAAAAALGAFQAAKQQKPLPPLPRTDSSSRAPTRDVSQISGPPDAYSSTYTNRVASSASQPTQYRATSGYGAPPVPSKNDSTSVPANETSEAKARGGNEQQDPIPAEAVRNAKGLGPQYAVSPQTTSGQAARRQVGFERQDPSGTAPAGETRDGRLRHLFHRSKQEEPSYRDAEVLDEWKSAKTAELTGEDLTIDTDQNADKAWWEQPGSKSKEAQKQNTIPYGASYDGTFDGEETTFSPPLFLKCGPLLRYAGIKVLSDEPGSSSSIVWTGSVMIVTDDSRSTYQSAPVLELFGQPKDVPANPPKDIHLDDGRVVPEFVDAIAGQVKIARNGQTLYVKPVDQLKGEVDLSKFESEDGLFTKSPPAADNTTTSAQNKKGGGRVRKVDGFRLHAEKGLTFWRFNLKVHLQPKEHRIAYRINGGPVVAFWVPAKDQSMNIMFHSCNGFDLPIDPEELSGPDPLWRDVLNSHQQRPFHVMIGGGDQLYNDTAMSEVTSFQDWLAIRNPEQKHSAKFTHQMQDELEHFYLTRYAWWYSKGLFGLANCQIPMVNIWDDHDIMDGYGSYPHHFMRTPVFSGVGAIAFKYYMLFQHQSVPEENQESESSWLLGASPGPYINHLSRHLFMSLGKGIAFLGLDCRTERMRDEIISEASYDLIFDRCEKEITRGQTKHLIVLLGVPISYPRFNFVENILTSRIMEPIKAIGRTGILGGFVNKFDGGVEILDDLEDHWTAKHHKDERNWLIQELQALAAEKSVRVTIISGDVHLAAVGQFYSNRKLGIPKDRDHRYMPNVISSAIVNAPPPGPAADAINRRNKVHHLDRETDEDMIPLFPYDVNGQERNNLHLMPRRNWCSISAFQPDPNVPHNFVRSDPSEHEQPQPRRSFSLTRRHSDGARPNMFRRISSRRAPPSSYKSPNTGTGNPYSTGNIDPRVDGPRESMDGQRVSTDNTSIQPSIPSRSNSLIRRVSSASARSRSGSRGAAILDINLEGGLMVSINCEVDQKDPAGITQPYRLLIPALFFGDEADPNLARAPGRVKSFFGSLKRKNTSKRAVETEGMPYEDTRMPYQPPAQRAPPETGDRSIEPTDTDDGDMSESEEFQDAPEQSPLPAVVSNEPPIQQSRAVENAMSQDTTMQGTVIPDSNQQQPLQTRSIHGPSSEWAGMGGASRTAQQPSVRSKGITEPTYQQWAPQPRTNSAAYFNQSMPQPRVISGASYDSSDRQSRAMPGPLTANPPTPSNAHFGSSTEQVMQQPVQQAIPRIRPTNGFVKSNSGSYGPIATRDGYSDSNAIGPAPPANFDKLPQSVQKRFSQYRRAPGAENGTDRRVQSVPSQPNNAWGAQPSTYRNGPMKSDNAYQAQPNHAQMSGSLQDARPTSQPPPRANWQPPRESYVRPQTPPRDSRAWLHDENALNDLLGPSAQLPSKRNSHQSSTSTKPPGTLPPQQAPFPISNFAVQPDPVAAPAVTTTQPQAATQPPTAAQPPITTQPTMPIAPQQPQPAAPAAAPTPSATRDISSPRGFTTYNDGDSESEISMPPSKPEIFMQDRTTSAAAAQQQRGSKISRMLGGDAPRGYDDSDEERGGAPRYNAPPPPAAYGAMPDKVSRHYGGDDGVQGQQARPGSSSSQGRTGIMGRMIRRVSEGGSGRRPSGEGGSSWRRWK